MNLNSISISSSGQYGIACCGNSSVGIYYSGDYGVNWTSSNAPVGYWNSISISSSGQYGIACASDATNDAIWYSQNFGASWFQSTTIYNQFWLGISISGNGQYGIACSYGGKVDCCTATN